MPEEITDDLHIKIGTIKKASNLFCINFTEIWIKIIKS